MNKAMKAALLSGLVFPGLGHLFLKKQVHAAILIVISVISLYLLLSSLLEIAEQITAQLQNGLVSPDINQIASEAASQNLGAPSLVLTFCWLIGIIDSYRIGRAQDKLETEQL